jgi:hypothetical protein
MSLRGVDLEFALPPPVHRGKKPQRDVFEGQLALQRIECQRVGPQGAAIEAPPQQVVTSVEAKQETADAQPDGETPRAPVAEPEESFAGHRYGSVPVLIAGQLVELDLMRLRPRAHAEPAALRRLIATVDTASLGRVRIDAQHIDGRLIVNFTGGAGAAAEELAACEEDIRRLLNRFAPSSEENGND